MPVARATTQPTVRASRCASEVHGTSSPTLFVSTRRLIATLSALLAARQARPMLTTLGIPLAIIASTLAQPWFLPCLAACAWWWSPRRSGWGWAGVLARGAIGAVWALAFSESLAALPTCMDLVGLAWIAAAVLIGLAGRASASTTPPARDLRVYRRGHDYHLRPTTTPVLRKRFAAHLAAETGRNDSKRLGRTNRSLRMSRRDAHSGAPNDES
jgi:hypothetical protein